MTLTPSDQTVLGEVTKSFSQLSSQLSINGIVVPRIDKCRDIFEFLNEYELATETLSEEDQVKLLVKSFPPGRYKTFYLSEIKELSTWIAIRKALIKRYSDTEDQDRHLSRVFEMRYDPKGNVKLYDYVEELLYSFSKAFPSEESDEPMIRFIKSNLPSSIKPSLAMNSVYGSAKTIEDLLPVFRQYDQARSSSEATDSEGQKTTNSEIVTLFKELMKEIKHDREARVVSAMQPSPRSQSPVHQPRGFDKHLPTSRREAPSPNRNIYYHSNTQRPNSPYYQQNHDQHMNQYRAISPQQRQYNQRTPSPNRQFINNNQSCYNSNGFNPSANLTNRYQPNQPINNSGYNPYCRGRSPPPQQNYSRNYHMQNVQRTNYPNYSNNQQQASPSVNRVFDDQAYFDKFGVPPSPCDKCGYMHFARHCQHLDRLN